MKNPRVIRDPSTVVNRTVTPRRPPNADLREREYLTPKESTVSRMLLASIPGTATATRRPS